MEMWNDVTEFWRGVIASIVATLILSASIFISKIAFPSISEIIRRRSQQINLLETRLASASSQVRGDAETEVLFKTVKWAIIGFFLWQISLVLPMAETLFWGLRLASIACVVVALWVISLRIFPPHLSRHELEEVLGKGDWVLTFRPPFGKKDLEFLSDGSFDAGRNNNEHSWAIVNHLLEIYQVDGDLHSRFVFDPSSGVFLSTNDSDTHNVRNQFISRRSE